jgi:autotransporter-associated beta strand protein
VYYDSDTVSFTDAGAGVQPTLDVVVNPAWVNFDSSADYALTSPTGNGQIAGLGGLSKGGTGTLTLSTTNTYVGGTIVTNGVLKLGVPQALGNPSGATPLASISNTGTLDLNGSALDATYTSPVDISGTGASATQGAIDNTVGGLTSGGGDIGIGTLALTGDATISASANWQIGNTGSGIVGNGHALTFTGPSYLYLKQAAASPLSGLVISGGGVLFWDHADAAGNTATITLTNSGFIDTWNPATYFQGLTFFNPLVVNGSGMIINYRQPFNHPGSDIFNGSVIINNGSLTFSNVAHVGPNTYNNNTEQFGRTTMNGNISGNGGVNVIGGLDYPVISPSGAIYGGNLVTLNGNNSYSGPTIVSNLVQLLISTANQSGGAYTVVNDGTLDVTTASGRPTIPMSSLTLDMGSYGGGNLGFTRLTQMPSSPVIYATNLNIVSSATILPPLAGYAVGQFPLIKYDNISGAGFAGLQLLGLPTGVTATLVDNAANKTIDLQVTTVGITWTGSSSSDWDLGITPNWTNPVSMSTDYYSDGEGVVFDDTAASFTVNLNGALLPGGVTINASKDYTFNTTAGGIGGSAAFVKNGSGTLTLACTNNTFTGGTYINDGTLKLADLNYAYPYGGGALNNNLGAVTVGDGATLDVNAVQVPNFQQYGPAGYNVYISGAGVGGNGALVNNNTNNNDNADPGYVTLTGDATVGGIGDLNIRHGGFPELNSQSSAYTLTKVGPASFRIRYVTAVSTNFGPVNILQGIVSYESSSPLGFGDSTKPVMIAGGAGFAWGTAAAACTKPLICSNNATIYGYNVTNNVFAAPVDLEGGNVNLNANYFHGMIFSNVLSGAGGVSVLYNSYVTFAAANTYTGDTTVWRCNAAPGSSLRLVGDGALNNSANITLQGIVDGQAYAGGLNVSGRTDHTLTLGSGQTLRGDNGSYVAGDVVAGSGAIITPGGAANAQYMTFSNNLTLSAGSVVAMDVGLDAGITNDLINVAGTNHYGGTLQLASLGATALTNGASFKLFNAAHFTGDFASISGSPGAGLSWSFDPATGVATVVGSAPSSPSIGMSVSGNQLTLSWPASYLGYTLQAQTNALSTGLSNNWVDVPGSSAGTNSVIIIDPSMPSVFYRLRQ